MNHEYRSWIRVHSEYNESKAIEEICGKSVRRGSFLRLLAPRVTFLKNKKKTVLRCGLGECVSLSFFVWPGGVTHINKYTNKEKHTHIYK